MMKLDQELADHFYEMLNSDNKLRIQDFENILILLNHSFVFKTKEFFEDPVHPIFDKLTEGFRISQEEFEIARFMYDFKDRIDIKGMNFFEF